MNQTDADAQRRQAPSTALELIKQVITLSAGVLAISATFATSLGAEAGWWMILLFVAWLSLFASILLGLTSISALTYNLEQGSAWDNGRVRPYAKCSKWSFMIGIGAFALFAAAMLALNGSAEAPIIPPRC